jgi:hypothetical protein
MAIAMNARQSASCLPTLNSIHLSIGYSEAEIARECGISPRSTRACSMSCGGNWLAQLVATPGDF